MSRPPIDSSGMPRPFFDPLSASGFPLAAAAAAGMAHGSSAVRPQKALKVGAVDRLSDEVILMYF